MQVTLQDSGLRIRDGTQRTRDEQGFLIVKDNPVAIAGVFPFLRKQVDSSSQSEDVVYVYRSPESVQRAADMFRNKPIVHRHKWVGKHGERSDADGTIGSAVTFRDGALYSDLIIYNPQLIDEIESGQCKQLSPGYNAIVTPATGEYRGQRYEFTIEYTGVNHLGVVENGRAGKQLSIKDKQDIYMEKTNNASIFTRIIKGTSASHAAASQVDAAPVNEEPTQAQDEAATPQAPRYAGQGKQRANGSHGARRYDRNVGTERLTKNQHIMDSAAARCAAGKLGQEDFNFIYNKLSDENKQILSKLKALETAQAKARKQQDAAAAEAAGAEALAAITAVLPEFKAYGERRPQVLYSRAYHVYTGSRLADGLDSRTAFTEAIKQPRRLQKVKDRAQPAVSEALAALHEWHLKKARR